MWYNQRIVLLIMAMFGGCKKCSALDITPTLPPPSRGREIKERVLDRGVSRKAMGRWRCDMRRTGCLKSWFISCRAVALAAIFCLVFSNAKADVPEINADYLDTLTGAKVTWEEVDAAGEDTIAIGDKFYKYTYHMPNGYKTNTRLDDNLTAENTTNKVFKGIEHIVNDGNAYGGAIYNTSASTEAIHSDFVDNYVNSGSRYAEGGAIYNYIGGTIGDITGDFIGNYAYSQDYANGGAIDNEYGSHIGDITGDFIDNYVYSGNGSASGGAIYNYTGGTIGDITGDFIGNYAYSQDYANGGAIDNEYGSHIGDITGDFIGNYAHSENYFASGGAIYNYKEGTIGDITGDFIGNYAHSENYFASGGAIYNYTGGTIGDITGNFMNNYVASLDSNASGGAIHNGGTIGDITGNFMNNYVTSLDSNASGGAIYNYKEGTIGDITGDFIGNYAYSENSNAYGGAIYLWGRILNNISGDFTGNYAQGKIAQGGAIYNADSITLINSSFYDNYAKGSDARGGAIFNEGELIITANNSNSIFSGNYTETINDDGTTTKKSNAIYSIGKINLNSINQGLIQFDDIITGVKALDLLVADYGGSYSQNEDGDYVVT
ncbi:MAG: hypothetical protein E7018_06385, partial [Alphaproteobacteria bacterium]|nr:hypothetical protein [Alphaproteobacteria bacterium]